MTFDERQQLLRLVIERITVEYGVARIDTVIPPGQDNLRDRYPGPVEGLLVGEWFYKLTTNGWFDYYQCFRPLGHPFLHETDHLGR